MLRDAQDASTSRALSISTFTPRNCAWLMWGDCQLQPRTPLPISMHKPARMPQQHFPPSSSPPPPLAKWNRTFTGLADRAGGSRRRPKSSSTKRPTPPALGPQSSGDPAMLPQRAGLRTGELAVKCAGLGLVGTAVALCGCAHPGAWAPSCLPLLSLYAGAELRLWPLHPAHRHGDVQGAKWRTEVCTGGCHGSRRAVAKAIDLAVELPDRQGKLTQWAEIKVWFMSLGKQQTLYAVRWINNYWMHAVEHDVPRKMSSVQGTW